jgi:hypothetical protein
MVPESCSDFEVGGRLIRAFMTTPCISPEFFLFLALEFRRHRAIFALHNIEHTGFLSLKTIKEPLEVRRARSNFFAPDEHSGNRELRTC